MRATTATRSFVVRLRSNKHFETDKFDYDRLEALGLAAYLAELELSPAEFVESLKEIKDSSVQKEQDKAEEEAEKAVEPVPAGGDKEETFSAYYYFLERLTPPPEDVTLDEVAEVLEDEAVVSILENEPELNISVGEPDKPADNMMMYLIIGIVACLFLVIIIMIVMSMRGGGSPPPQAQAYSPSPVYLL